jgi:exonuclease VII large subunit
LERGYALAQRDDGAVVRSSAEIGVGDTLELTFRVGGARVRVESRRD